jgi:hypothetical protein
MKFPNQFVCTLALALSFASSGSFAASLEAYAFSVSTQSGVGTYGAPTYLNSHYTGGFYPVYDGAAPNSEDIASGSTGPQSATSSISGGGNSTYGLWSSASSSDATASYGVLGVAASTSASGGGDANTLRGAVAYADSTETFNVTGGTGTALFRATYTVDGSWSASGAASLDLELIYRVNGGPATIAYRIQGNGSPGIYFDGGWPYYPSGYVGTLPGLTVTPNSVTGSTDISFAFAFTLGTAFDLTTGLYAAAVPGGGTTSGTIDFLSTARLTGIDIIQGSSSLSGFSIQSGSGTQYTAQGAVVPLPPAIWMLGSGLGVLGWWTKRGARA